MKKEETLDILKLIKKRCSVRKYTDQPISEEVLDKILEAGIWGPSIHGFQPWKFVVIKDRNLIDNISKEFLKKVAKFHTGYNLVVRSTAATIANSKVLVVIFDDETITNRFGKLGKKYRQLASITSNEAIGAVIQNMILTSENFGVGCCWLTIPLLFESFIKRRLKTNGKLAAILTLGFPSGRGKRSNRKEIQNTIKYLG